MCVRRASGKEAASGRAERTFAFRTTGPVLLWLLLVLLLFLLLAVVIADELDLLACGDGLLNPS